MYRNRAVDCQQAALGVNNRLELVFHTLTSIVWKGRSVIKAEHNHVWVHLRVGVV